MKFGKNLRIRTLTLLAFVVALVNIHCRNQRVETPTVAVAPAAVPVNPAAVPVNPAAVPVKAAAVPVKAAAVPVKAAVTFIELGSVSCIPCKQMQLVMKSVEKKYGSQIKVVFYNVLKGDEEQSDKYGVRLIPTQVFLDSSGKEFSRHEGFYPEAELDRLLQAHGLKAQSVEAGHD